MAILTIACSDESTAISDDVKSAMRNFEQWSAQVNLNFDVSTDTLIVQGIVGSPNDEVIGFKFKFEEPGTYELTDKQCWYFTTIGGDVIVSTYKLQAGSVGHVQ
jgi:hypothetical protein